jgi:hypothetical protein
VDEAGNQQIVVVRQGRPIGSALEAAVLFRVLAGAGRERPSAAAEDRILEDTDLVAVVAAADLVEAGTFLCPGWGGILLVAVGILAAVAAAVVDNQAVVLGRQVPEEHCRRVPLANTLTLDPVPTGFEYRSECAPCMSQPTLVYERTIRSTQ